ncbi:hypothetical protein BDY19DRAFT_387991 [Irpex rosettiformis]|uniref:Uncharacterized protein n=1 Tax=Irpex rosettiformis TaxID=378272 RepID=A0ACB8TVK9_9APHY|nr:hypothetical protein BDY19DRAFT_387991 [Irpex rosettiformis]
MAQATRSYDGEKVQDCKEDIDTLLVFAGLFSAVLTGFLIESYKNLSEDSAKQTLLATRQLITQTSSYSFEGSMLNSTANTDTSYSTQPFRPSATAIRVNVLWFSSLLFSLFTASFGILVKQWLREFLAVQDPSPRARLRIRHFRYSQLMRWKVFEIAAILPLILQLALALFFVGLCYFTASVHASIGYTTLPLAIGWAFCFSSVTVLPIFFPRCPYRTTLLKSLLQSFHGTIGSCSGNVSRKCKAALSRSSHVLQNQWTKKLLMATEAILARLSAYLSEVDEMRVMQGRERDLEILESVDSIQSDDELLGTAIAEAVEQVHCDPAQFEHLLRVILENRGLSTPQSGSRSESLGAPFPLQILDLRHVSKHARNAICSVVSHYTTHARFEAGTIITSPGYIKDTVFRVTLMAVIMLSISNCPLPEDGLYLLRGRNFGMHGFKAMSILIRQALNTPTVGFDPHDDGYEMSENKLRLLIRGLGRIWCHLDVGTGILLKIVRGTLAVMHKEAPNRIESSSTQQEDYWSSNHIPPEVKCDFMGLIFKAVGSLFENENGIVYESRDFDIKSALESALRLSFHAGLTHLCDQEDSHAFDPILDAMLSRPEWTHDLVDVVLDVPFSWLHVFATRWAERIASRSSHYAIDVYAIDWCSRLDNYLSVSLLRLSDADKPISKKEGFKLCYFATCIARFLIAALPPREQWVDLFEALLDHVENPTEGPPSPLFTEEEYPIAEQMVFMIQGIELGDVSWTYNKPGDDESYAKWAGRSDSTSIFPERLIRCVAPYVNHTHAADTWRFRRAYAAMGAGTVTVEAHATASGTLVSSNNETAAAG